MIIRRLSACLAALLLIPLAGCAEDAAPVEADGATPSLEDDLIPSTPGGKFDTGYLSNLATELEGTLSSTVTVDVSELPIEEREFELQRLEENSWSVRQLVDAQIRFAKNQINASKLHINLSAGEFEVTEMVLDEAGLITITYTTTVETIVTAVELEEDGLSIEDIVTGSFTAIVPSDPPGMVDVGAPCVDEEHAEDVGSHNYFYYFQAEREGCAEAMDAAGIQRIEATLVVESLAPSKTVYPEYDQLTADGRIDVVVFFGAAKHDWEPGDWDWGTYQRDIFVRDLQQRDFVKGETERGELYTRTVGELVENVQIIGPETLKLLRDDQDGLFTEVVRNNEIIFYNGHSFYGSLDVLDNDIYPGTYQIFFMNSCWSYEYYTKQIFRNNATDEDPDGWLLADVVNDTESGWFHNMAGESRILLTNLLAGAEAHGIDGDRYYTWDRIIGAMNAHAQSIQDSRGTETHEIYGVSGVTSNVFVPPTE